MEHSSHHTSCTMKAPRSTKAHPDMYAMNGAQLRLAGRFDGWTPQPAFQAAPCFSDGDMSPRNA
jgi:hypothetical protein